MILGVTIAHPITNYTSASMSTARSDFPCARIRCVPAAANNVSRYWCVRRTVLHFFFFFFVPCDITTFHTDHLPLTREWIQILEESVFCAVRLWVIILIRSRYTSNSHVTMYCQYSAQNWSVWHVASLWNFQLYNARTDRKRRVCQTNRKEY